MNNGRSGAWQTIVNAGLASAWRNARHAFQLTDQSRAPCTETALSPRLRDVADRRQDAARRDAATRRASGIACEGCARM